MDGGRRFRKSMGITVVRFLNIILAALVSGTVFGIFFGCDPANLSYETYVEQQQLLIRSLAVMMTILGWMTIALTCLSAYLQRDDRNVFLALLLAAGLFVATGIITRVGIQPINAIMLTWSRTLAPDNWTELRDEWWTFHTVRMYAALVSLALIIWASIKK